MEIDFAVVNERVFSENYGRILAAYLIVFYSKNFRFLDLANRMGGKDVEIEKGDRGKSIL